MEILMFDIFSNISGRLHFDYFDVMLFIIKICIVVITPIDCVYCQ